MKPGQGRVLRTRDFDERFLQPGGCGGLNQLSTPLRGLCKIFKGVAENYAESDPGMMGSGDHESGSQPSRRDGRPLR
jgi:hypothetical protein